MGNKKFICPICGYDGLEEQPYDETGEPSFEICDCCGFEFGFDDLSEHKTFEEYKNEWLINGAKWQHGTISQGWDLQNHLKNIISCKEDLIKALYTVDNSNFNHLSAEQKKVCCEFTIDLFKKFPNFKYDKELNLPYIIAGNFVDYMQTLVNTDEEELAECLNYIESLFLSEYSYIKELVTVGFIEGIQNSWSDENKKIIYKKLGKNSKKAWNDLNKFWEGK